MESGNWVPFAVVLFLAFLIGGILSLVFSSLGVDANQPNPDSIVGNSFVFVTITNWISADFIDFIDTGISIFGYDISVPILNPLAIIGQESQDWIVSQLVILTYIPDRIMIPFMIFFALAFVWTGIKMILP